MGFTTYKGTEFDIGWIIEQLDKLTNTFSVEDGVMTPVENEYFSLRGYEYEVRNGVVNVDLRIDMLSEYDGTSGTSWIQVATGLPQPSRNTYFELVARSATLAKLNVQLTTDGSLYFDTNQTISTSNAFREHITYAIKLES